MAVTSAISYVYEIKIPTVYWISACFILSLFLISSFIGFNAYAQQQGGAATGGGAQLNQGTGVIITCTVNNACVITGNSANGGSATGGNANINVSKEKSQISSSIIQDNQSIKNQ